MQNASYWKAAKTCLETPPPKSNLARNLNDILSLLCIILWVKNQNYKYFEMVAFTPSTTPSLFIYLSIIHTHKSHHPNIRLFFLVTFAFHIIYTDIMDRNYIKMTVKINGIENRILCLLFIPCILILILFYLSL